MVFSEGYTNAKKLRLRENGAGYIRPDAVLNEIKQEISPLILISGMAGCGKTALLSCLAAELPDTVVCVLDKSDRDEAIMLSDVYHALRSVCPGLSVPEGCSAEAVLNRLVGAANRQRISFLFDQYVSAPGNGADDILRYLIENLEGRVILACRTTPDFAARYKLAGQCREIKGERLLLTREEIARELTRRELCQSGAQQETADRLYELTGGWAAGVAYMLDHAADAGELGSTDACLESFVQSEILEPMDAEHLSFVQKTAYFNRFDAKLAEEVFSLPDAPRLLSGLQKTNLFLRHDDKGFYYAPLFRQAVLSMESSEQKQPIMKSISSYYFRSKQFPQAVTIAYENKDAAAAYTAIAVYGQAILRAGRLDLIGQCLSVLDRQNVADDPVALGTIAQYYYGIGNYERMEAYFNWADSLFGKENNYSVLRSFYRGLLRYPNDPALYRKQINNALFYFNEVHLPLPFLVEKDLKLLEEIRTRNTQETGSAQEKPLEVTMFGNFNVVIVKDGYELPWRTRKGAELFAYLLSLGGQTAERGKLLDILWEYEIPNNAVPMLHNMIYNIRKELAVYQLENVILYKNKKYSLDLSLIHTDMDRIAPICAAVREKNTAKLVENADRLSEYWGCYLENIDSTWVSEMKEYYDRVFVEASLMLARHYEKQGIYERALRFLNNASKVDSYSERVMERLLLCLSAAGKIDKLRQKYSEFEELLQRSLQITPSEQLKTTYCNCLKRVHNG